MPLIALNKQNHKIQTKKVKVKVSQQIMNNITVKMMNMRSMKMNLNLREKIIFLWACLSRTINNLQNLKLR